MAAAQHNVGVCYYSGLGVEKDYEKVVNLYTLAANQGDKEAQCNFACCLVTSEGVKLSFVKAIYWLRQCLKNNEDDETSTNAKNIFK